MTSSRSHHCCRHETQFMILQKDEASAEESVDGLCSDYNYVHRVYGLPVFNMLKL